MKNKLMFLPIVVCSMLCVNNAQAQSFTGSPAVPNSVTGKLTTGGKIAALEISGPVNGYRGSTLYFTTGPVLADETLVWSVTTQPATLTGGQGTESVQVFLNEVAGTDPYYFLVSVTATSSNGSVRTASLRVASLYCSSCPID